MKKTIFLVFCLLIILMITSCQIHIDTDPWPASPGYGELDATEAPSAAPVLTPEEPAATVTTHPTEELVPVVTPTPQPSNDIVEPGFNG